MIQLFVLHNKGNKAEPDPQQKGKASLGISVSAYEKALLQLLQSRQIRVDLLGMPVEHGNPHQSSI